MTNTSDTETMDTMLTVEQVSRRLGMNQAMVRRLLRDGRLPGYRLGGRRTGWRVSTRELAAWLDARRGPGSGR